MCWNIFPGCSVKYLQVLIGVNKCWKCSLQHVHVKCRHNVLVSPSIWYYVKHMENHIVTLYASALHYVNHKLVNLDVHTTFLFPELQLYAYTHTIWLRFLITCEWQSFLSATMLVTERLLLVSGQLQQLFDTVVEPVSECSIKSYSYFNIIISMPETVTDHLL